MKVGSLFAGVGGFDLAFSRVGFGIEWVVEIDESCRKLLARRFPEVALYSDIRDCGAYNLSAVDVLVGGWPCQPFSVAGRRRGADDERDLWPEFARLAGELRPRWVVGENVSGLLSIDEGSVWARTVTDLCDLGYGVAWRVLDAQHFGVPQRRRRVFVVGCLGDLAGPAQVLFESEGGARDPAAGGTSEQEVAGTLGGGSRQAGWNDDLDRAGAFVVSSLNTHGRRLDGDSETFVADTVRSHPRPGSNSLGGVISHTLSAEGADVSKDGTGRGTPLIAFQNGQDLIAEEDLSQPVTGSHGQPPAIAVSENQRAELRETLYSRQITTGGGKPGQGYPTVRDGMIVRRLTPLECERLQGFPDGWTEGQADSTRYRQLGNAVAVPVVEWIARRIIQAEFS